MKILIAVLNWGLGHATRCIPIIAHYIAQGDEVVIGGNGESLLLLRKRFPQLRYLPLSDLEMQYSKTDSQTWAIVRQIPKLLYSSLKDQILLKRRLEIEPFDLIISDNRFGLWAKDVKCIYITHQLHIEAPKGWQWISPIIDWLHGQFYKRYDTTWVPDYAKKSDSLAGDLSHPKRNYAKQVVYMGPQSRFSLLEDTMNTRIIGDFEVVIVLSGIAPQRQILRDQLIERYIGKEEKVLIVEGLIDKPFCQRTFKNITILPHLDDTRLAYALKKAKHIIARSGYTSIMDFAILNCLDKTEWIPTPGQSEQEYLASWIRDKG